MKRNEERYYPALNMKANSSRNTETSVRLWPCLAFLSPSYALLPLQQLSLLLIVSRFA